MYLTYEYIRGRRLGVIRLNSQVADRIAKDSIRGMVHPRYLPMLVKPKPWVSHHDGGYLYSKGAFNQLRGMANECSSYGPSPCHAVQRFRRTSCLFVFSGIVVIAIPTIATIE